MKDTNYRIIWSDVGYRVRILREEKGETQSDLGAAIGETRSLVNMWESGERPIKAEPLLALANHFDCTVDYILGNSTARSPAPDMQTAVSVTGLSEQAIRMISQFHGEHMDILNSLLCDSDFFTLILRASEYKEEIDHMHSELRDYDVNTLESPQDLLDARMDLLGMRDVVDLSKLKLGRLLEKSLDSIYDTASFEAEIDAVKDALKNRVEEIIPAMPDDEVEYSDDGQETS